MKTVTVRLNKTVEYEVTLNVMDYYNDNTIRNLALALENENMDDLATGKLGAKCRMIAEYNDVIGWVELEGME